GLVKGHRLAAAPNPEQHRRPRSRRPVGPAHLPRRAPTRPESQTSRAALPSRAAERTCIFMGPLCL
ncbi:hypothetical protein T484DRAFT_1960025, partial [Baffinella frigidus]